MSPENDALLCSRYPLIFADRTLSPVDNAMGRGFECDDGWFELIDVLCERIQFVVDRDEREQVVARQVKEKFGTLRFRVNVAGDDIRGMIDMAESLSGRVCEVCGCLGTVMQKPGYTRCPDHPM